MTLEDHSHWPCVWINGLRKMLQCLASPRSASQITANCFLAQFWGAMVSLLRAWTERSHAVQLELLEGLVLLPDKWAPGADTKNLGVISCFWHKIPFLCFCLWRNGRADTQNECNVDMVKWKQILHLLWRKGVFKKQTTRINVQFSDCLWLS